MGLKIMNEQETGTCSVCGHRGVVLRKYYHYDVDCDCCNGNQHFEIVWHHKSCEPKPPANIKIILEMQPNE